MTNVSSYNPITYIEQRVLRYFGFNPSESAVDQLARPIITNFEEENPIHPSLRANVEKIDLVHKYLLLRFARHLNRFLFAKAANSIGKQFFDSQQSKNMLAAYRENLAKHRVEWITPCRNALSELHTLAYVYFNRALYQDLFEQSLRLENKGWSQLDLDTEIEIGRQICIQWGVIPKDPPLKELKACLEKYTDADQLSAAITQVFINKGVAPHTCRFYQLMNAETLAVIKLAGCENNHGQYSTIINAMDDDFISIGLQEINEESKQLNHIPQIHINDLFKHSH